jgi:hypothetical protein
MESRSIDLGTFDETMEVTERFRQQGWKLPPGTVRAGLLGMKMMPAKSCLSSY